jgi:hypothetical protein
LKKSDDKTGSTKDIWTCFIQRARCLKNIPGLLDNLMRYHGMFADMVRGNSAEVVDDGMADTGINA